MNFAFARPFYDAHRRAIKRALVLFLALAVFVGSYVGTLQAMGNFHSVVDGQLYRVAQPSPQQLTRYVQAYSIQTVINLRGENKGRAWYDQEVATARQLGVRHIDFRMSAKNELPQAQAVELISILRDAPKPILIHCNGGSDRSGLAAALYLAAIAGQGEYAAEAQLSLRFGHFSIPFLSSSYAMDQTFENMEPWLGFTGS